MLIAYFDDSGGEDRSALSLGGFVATAQRWRAFEQKWKAALSREDITTFHMSDYESGYGEFKGWKDDKDRCRRLIVRLSSIIKDTIMFGTSSSFILKDYQEVIVPRLTAEDDPRRLPYVLALQSCLEDIVAAMEIPKTEKVAVVCDENSLILGAASSHFVEIKKAKDWGDVFGSLTFGSTQDFVLLQAADILTYEGYKYVTNQIVREVNKPLRKSFVSLERSRRITFGHYNAAGLKRFAAKVDEIAWVLEGSAWKLRTNRASQ